MFAPAKRNKLCEFIEREFGFFEDVLERFLRIKNFLKKIKKSFAEIKKSFIFAPALRNKPGS